jgi:hypothetical protein
MQPSSQKLDGWRFDSRQNFSLLASVQSGSGVHPIQWVPGALSAGIKSQVVKLTTHLHVMPRSRMVELYLHSLIRLHDVVLN